jgi:hypothetical protein
MISDKEQILANIYIHLTILLLAALVAALLLQLIIKWLFKFNSPYLTVYKATVLAYVANFGLIILFLSVDAYNSLVTAFPTVPSSATFLSLASAVTLPSLFGGFFVASGLFGIMIKHPESGRIGLGKGCLMQLVSIMVLVVFYVLVVLFIVHGPLLEIVEAFPFFGLILLLSLLIFAFTPSGN